MNLENQPHQLFPPAKAEQVARAMQLEDPDWNYTVRHDPKGTGQSFIEIHDEDGEFISRL